MMLLDTDVIIDIGRGYPPAVLWLQGLDPSLQFSISGYTAMEAIAGCNNNRQLQSTQHILRRFRVLWLLPDQSNDALALFARYRLSHGAGLIDTLVGYTAIINRLPIFTFNRKHFRFLPDLQLVELYSRSAHGMQ